MLVNHVVDRARRERGRLGQAQDEAEEETTAEEETLAEEETATDEEGPTEELTQAVE